MRDLFRKILWKIAHAFGVHPEVGSFISGSLRLSNPQEAQYPAENLPFATRVIASGMWNYCFFQFYRHFAGPYWVERQYNPADPSFIPRASSMLSVNLTHRTWMGFRGPDSKYFSMVDPAGALSPVVGYYSIEVALMIGGRLYLPTRREVEVSQDLIGDCAIPRTTYTHGKAKIVWSAAGSMSPQDLVVSSISYDTTEPIEILISIRPFNPEGGSPLHSISYQPTGNGGIVYINKNPEVALPVRPTQIRVSNLEGGDAYFTEKEGNAVDCRYGVATAAFVYPVNGKGKIDFHARTYYRSTEDWSEKPRIRAPQEHHLGAFLNNPAAISAEISKSKKSFEQRVSGSSQFKSARGLWNQAASVFTHYVNILRNGDEITPGVFTYRQFWFRDAAYMIDALCQWNLLAEAKEVLLTYPRRQNKDGFFKSHEGEWDSNGQAIWTLMRYYRVTNDIGFLREMYPSIEKGAKWIVEKKKTGLLKKLMPAGFSAEHLGPADYYYWDNMWSISGLEEAAVAAELLGKSEKAARYRHEAEEYKKDLLAASFQERNRLGVITAAPGRPIDSGMIGSICMLYPLELELIPRREMRNTIHTIYKEFFNRELFFHPIIHSGYNIYLSLQVAECFLYLGEIQSARTIFKRVIKRRTDLWTYPEAIHPLTGGGVMGDGFHGWAFAEVLLLLKNLTIRRQKETLVLFPGLRRKELFGEPIHFGPFPMDGGFKVTISGELSTKSGELLLELPGIEQSGIKRIEIQIPGRPKTKVIGGHLQDSEDGCVITPLSDRITVQY